jgi:hypothetical protein
MRYQMWHVETRNLMDDFDREAEALEAVRANLTPDEKGETVEVLLIVNDDAGAPLRSIDGDELARLAFGPSNDQARRSA